MLLSRISGRALNGISLDTHLYKKKVGSAKNSPFAEGYKSTEYPSYKNEWKSNLPYALL